MISEASKKISEKANWKFKDGAECALNYGVRSCIKTDEGFKLQPVGFMFIEHQGMKVAPIYFSKRVGIVSPNGYPVRLGSIKTSDRMLDNIGNLFMNRGLHTQGCYIAGGRITTTYCGTKTELLEKRPDKKSSILTEYGLKYANRGKKGEPIK